MADYYQENDDAYKSLAKNVKDYADLRIQLAKLQIVEKVSQILSLLVVIIASSILLMGAFLYLSMMFVVWLQTVTGSYAWGFLCVALFFVFLFFLFVIFRKKLIINPIIRKMSAIMFKEPEEEEVDNEE